MDGERDGQTCDQVSRGMLTAESKWTELEDSVYNSSNYSVCLITFRKKCWGINCVRVHSLLHFKFSLLEAPGEVGQRTELLDSGSELRCV